MLNLLSERSYYTETFIILLTDQELIRICTYIGLFNLLNSGQDGIFQKL